MTEQNRKVQLEASLGTQGVKEGTAEIKREVQSMAQAVGQSSAQAGQALESGIVNAVKRANAATGEVTKSLSDWQRFVGANMASAMKEFGGHGPAMKALGEQWRAMSAEAKQAAAGVSQAASSMTQGIAPAIPATNQLTAAQTRFLETLKRQAIGLTDGKAALLEYRAAQMGLGDAATPYIAKIREAEKAVNAGTIAFDKHGLSAKQAAAAMRGIPAQMQDIVVSLQAGQNPMTVFLQQGSQLSTVFNGTGNALRAVGGYLLGLVNPFTVAAAAAAGLAFAYHEGSKESDGYRKALLLTGNAAGTSTQQLADMAREMSRISGTQGKAAEALTALAATGQVGAANLQEFARTSIDVEKTLGRSIEEMAKDFADLGKSPLAAADKLNEAYRFMNSATRQQIKTLEEQGRTEEAAALAQKTYSQAFADRAKEVEANLGLLERGWAKVAGEAKKGWDAILDVGRPATVKDKLSQISDELENYNPFNIFGPSKEKLREDQAAQQELARLQRQASEAAGASAARNEARRKFDQGGDQFLSRQAQLARDLTKELNLAIAAGATLEETQQRLKDVAQNKYADLYNGGIDSQIEALKRTAAVQDEISKRGIDQIKTKRDFGILSEREYLEAVAKLELADLDRKKAGLGAELKLTAGKANSLKEQQAIMGQLALLDQQRLTAIEKQADAEARRIKRLQDIGRDTIASQFDEDAAARAAEDAKRLSSTNAAIKLANDYGKTIADNNALTELEISLLGQTEERRNVALEQARIRLDLEKQLLALDALQLDAEEKAARAAQLRTAASQAEVGAGQRVWLDGWKKINDDVGRSLTDALIRGGKSAGQYIKDYFRTLTLRPIIQTLVSPISGAIASIFAPNVASAAGTSGAASSIFQGASLVTAGKTLWDGFSGAMAANSGGLISGFGGLVGSQSISAFGAGMSIPASELAGMTGAAAVDAGVGVTGSAASSLSAGSSFGAALPWIAGAAAVAAIVAKGLSMKTVGSGILGSISGDDFSGNAYEFKKGGFLRGGSKTVTSELDKATGDVFDSAIKAMSGNFSALGKTIGVGGDLLKDFSYEFRLALADFDDAGKQKEIQRALSSMSDSMAQAFVDSFRTSVDTAKQQASRYFTNTSDGARTFSGGVVDKAAVSSPLDPYIADIIRLFDKQKEALTGVAGSEGKLADFTRALFGLGDGLVENAGYVRLFGEALDFAKLEAAATGAETVVDTFTRINSVFSVTNTLAETLGNDVSTAFGAIGLASTDARQGLITLAGGIDSLAAKTAFFSQNFLSPEEQLAPIKKSVMQTMSDLGFATVDTKEEFSDLVKGIRTLGDEASQNLLVKLLDIAPAFLQVANATKDLAATAVDSAQTIRDATIETARAAADNAMGAVDTAFSGLQRAIQAQRNILTEAHEATMRGLQDSLDAVSGRVSKLSSLSGALRNTIDRIAGTGMDRQTAQAQIQTALAIAKASGAFPDVESISKALETVSQTKESDFASFIDFKRDQLLTKSTLQELSGLTDAQKSVEEQTLDSIKDQIKKEEDFYKQQMKGLDDTLDFWQDEIDKLNGIDTGIKSVADAVAALAGAINAARLNPVIAAASQVQGAYQSALGRTAQQSEIDFWKDQVAGGRTVTDVVGSITGSREAQITNLYRTLLGRDPDAAGMRVQYDSGLSVDQLRSNFMNSAEYLRKIRGFADGTNWIPKDRMALVHEGERIIPKADNTALIAALQNRGADNAAVVNALARVEKLLSDISAETRATAQHSSGTKKILQRVVPDGDAIATRAEA